MNFVSLESQCFPRLRLCLKIHCSPRDQSLSVYCWFSANMNTLPKPSATGLKIGSLSLEQWGITIFDHCSHSREARHGYLYKTYSQECPLLVENSYYAYIHKIKATKVKYITCYSDEWAFKQTLTMEIVFLLNLMLGFLIKCCFPIISVFTCVVVSLYVLAK